MSLRDLPRIRDARRGRASSYDRSGGNEDFRPIAPGATLELLQLRGAGVVTHLWVTLISQDPVALRSVSLRIWWDGEAEPSVDVPLGDFFGVGFAETHDFVSLPLQMSPAGGRAMNCWFPMPFHTEARIEVWNESALPVTHFFYYADYEIHDRPDWELGTFHAAFARENPTDGIDPSGLTNHEFQMAGVNPTGSGNYDVLRAEGQGHYVGCVLSIQNLRHTHEHNWYGEGDDMIFIDGDPSPTLHGTGTEDYFNTAWCPAEAYHAPYHGITMPGGPNYSGRVGLYRFHIEDPVMFRRSIRVSIEHGHANRRSDDWSSVAYWYQREPHAPLMPRVPAALRIPRPL